MAVMAGLLFSDEAGAAPETQRRKDAEKTTKIEIYAGNVALLKPKSKT
jgi:hypothetical protein